MMTLSELLATFPDPPKTLLNNKSNTTLTRNSSTMLLSGLSSHISHSSHGSHGNLNSGASSPSLSTSGVVGGGSLDMSMGIKMGGVGLNRSFTPASSSSITAGGGSAVSTGYQQTDLTLLERSCREELDGGTQGQVFSKLLSEPVLIVERALDLAYSNARTVLMKDLAAAKKKKLEKLEKESPCSVSVFPSKHFMDFGNHLTAGQEVTDTLDITNNTGNKIKFRIVVPPQATPMETDTFALSVSPQEGVIKKKDAAHIQFKLRAKQPGQLGLVVLVAVEGGLRFHALVKQEIFAQ